MNLFDNNCGQKQFAVLVDPDKNYLNKNFIDLINQSKPDYVFVGGSQDFSKERLDTTISELKTKTSIPVVLFPGSQSQLSEAADAVLALSVIQAENNCFVFSHLIECIDEMIQKDLKIYFSPYILGPGSELTSVGKVLKGAFHKIENISTFQRYLKVLSLVKPKVVYIEAGSGSENKISNEWVSTAKKYLSDSYLIIGGGVRKRYDVESFWDEGADCVVVGNYLEQNPVSILEFCECRNNYNR